MKTFNQYILITDNNLLLCVVSTLKRNMMFTFRGRICGVINLLGETRLYDTMIHYKHVSILLKSIWTFLKSV